MAADRDDGWMPKRSRRKAVMFVAILFILLLLLDIGRILEGITSLLTPILASTAVFYVLTLYLSSSWNTPTSYFVISSCIVGEIFNSTFFDRGSGLSIQFLLTVLICLSISLFFSNLDKTQATCVIFSVSAVRFVCCTSFPIWQIAPFLAYICAFIGTIAAKRTEATLNSANEDAIAGAVAAASATDYSFYGEQSLKTPSIKRRISSSGFFNVPFSQRVGRRTSLPAMIQKPHQSSPNSYESAIISEAHGLVSDMLADTALPPNVVSGLKAISSLLKPADNLANSSLQRPRNFHNLVNLNDVGSECDQDLPYTGERPSSLPKRLRRSLPQSIMRRMSSSTWTTTTSATGMPTLEPEPCRTRSASIRNIGHDSTPVVTPLQSNSPSPSSPNSAISLVIPKTRSHSLMSVSRKSSRRDTTQPLYRRLNITSDYESSESPGSSDQSDHAAQTSTVGTSVAVQEDEDEDVLLAFDVAECEREPILQSHRICEWDYPIFEMADLFSDTILSRMAYRIFSETGLMETFKIPIEEFLNYFHTLELGYQDKPYHNRIHASDVLHAVYYLTTQHIPGFVQIESNSTGENTQRMNLANTEESYGIMGNNFAPLELMALYTAAAMHDYDHPGRTNAFLVATYDEKAVLYNDRSVLENYHAAAAWKLLMSRPDFNWLRGLDKAEFRRFRFLVVEAILATDLKRHFEIIAEFNSKVNDDDAPGFDWHSETDRVMISNMLIKIADINGPCKSEYLHKRWTKSITQEFYEQGDEESQLGMVISPFMDRKNPQLAKLQESFINHLVAPLCNALGKAGLLPGSWDESEAEENDEREDINEKSPKENEERKLKNVRCWLTKHLRENHEMWVNVLKKEQENDRESEEVKREMEPIREEDTPPQSANQIKTH